MDNEHIVLIADMEVPANSVIVAKLVLGEEKELSKPIEIGDKIDSVIGISLEFSGFDSEEAKLMFKYIDSKQGISETVEYSIRYWVSYVLDFGPEHLKNSGPYHFRPIRGQLET